MTLEWVIVGGGIHGTHIATRLLDAGATRPEDLRIVDPGPRLLQRWWGRVGATGMEYLRSASVHHLDTHPFALRRFARRERKGVPGLFAIPYERPAVDLFRDHCDHVIARHDLEARHLRDSVAACQVGSNCVRLGLASGSQLAARRVVLAIGSSERMERPTWARAGHPRIQHVFGRDLAGSFEPVGERVAVVGGGTSALQVALRLAREGHAVDLVSRHPLRKRDFDTDPGWLGPKFMEAFERTRDPALRRWTVDRCRLRGTAPADVLQGVRFAVQREELRFHESDVAALEDRARGLALRLSSSARLELDDVLLATGLSPSRPGGRWVDDLIRSASLPCAPCGFPVVDPALRWHPRIHVSGPLAELELGPAARNIAGARRAADRILASSSTETPAAVVRETPGRDEEQAAVTV